MKQTKQTAGTGNGQRYRHFCATGRQEEPAKEQFFTNAGNNSKAQEFHPQSHRVQLRLKGGKKFFEHFEAFRGEHQHLHLIRERPEGETEDGTGDHVPKGGPA